MTSSTEKDASARHAQSKEFDLDRIERLVSDLEQDLAKAPANTPHLQELQSELEEFKQTLASAPASHGPVHDRLHAIRAALQKVTATVEGQVLLDTPYIAEAGRILGLI